MRISNYGANYNDYSANNEFLKDTDTSSKYFQNSKTKTPISKTNGTQTSKEFEALKKLLNSTAKNASGLRDIYEKLSATDQDSLFAKAKENGSTKDVVSGIKDFISQYNDMFSGIKKIGGTENKAYQQELNAYFKDNEEALKAVGITQNADGTLAIDEKILEKADVESLEKLFSGASSFASKISIKSIYIEANLMKSQQSNDLLSDINSYNNYTNQAQRMSQPYRYYLK